MAQPDPYDRQTRFTGTEAGKATARLGVNLDKEFDEARLTIEQARINLGLIQRDDTKLANKSVHAESLDDTVLALMDTGAFHLNGTWSIGKALAQGDIVSYSGALYLALVSHTAADIAADKAANKLVGPIFDPNQVSGFATKLAATTGSTLVGAEDGASGTLWTTVQGFISKLLSSAGASIVGFIQAGTGAVAGTVQTELRETITVKQFGAKGDGVTDDTAAFNLAINYLNTLPNPARLVLNGNFVINGSLNPITSRRKVISGYGATINHDAGTLFTFASGSSAGVVEGIQYFCTNTPTSGTCMVAQEGGNQIVLKDLTGKVNCFLRSGLTTFAGGYIVENCNFSTINGTQVVIDHGNGAVSQINNLVLTANGTNRVLDQTTPTNATATAIKFGSGAWDTAVWSGLLINGYLYGLDINRTAANVNIGNFRVTNFYFDFCANGMRLTNTASGGGINNLYFANGWVVGMDGYGVNIDTGSFSSIKFNSVQSMLAGKNNWRLNGSGFTSITLENCVGQFANRYNATNTGSDQDDFVSLSGGFRVYNSRFGQSANGFVTTGVPNWQGRYGINIAPSIINYVVQSCQMEGKTADCSMSFAGNTIPNGSLFSAYIKDNIVYGGAAKPAYAVTSSYAVPASNAVQTNNTPFTYDLYIYGGTVSQVNLNGAQVSNTTGGNLTVKPGDTWFIAYTVAPTLVQQIWP